MSLDKEKLRAEARAYVPPYTPEEIRRKFTILGKFVLLREGNTGFFSPLANEPDLRGLVFEAEKRGEVLYPRVEGQNLVFAPEGEMSPGALGVLEPRGPASALPPDLIFVPGLMFDRQGCRLGRGKGYYDRYLAKFEGLKVGVCFAACLGESLPREPHDVAMDFVLTENELIDCRPSYRGGAGTPRPQSGAGTPRPQSGAGTPRPKSGL